LEREEELFVVAELAPNQATPLSDDDSDGAADVQLMFDDDAAADNVCYGC
jgi:hypothetical protein